MHIGLAGFMGVNVADAQQPVRLRDRDRRRRVRRLGGFTPPVNSGALICDVYPGCARGAAGLAGGDVITSVNGTTVSTADGLTNQMSGSKPGSQFSIIYVDQYGARHTTTVTLTEWAK